MLSKEDEIKIVCLLPADRITNANFEWSRVRNLIGDTCCLESHYRVLLEIMLGRKLLPTNWESMVNPTVDIQSLFSVLNSPDALQRIPKFTNARLSYANVKLIEAVFILTEKKYLGDSDIKAGLIAFQLVSRELKRHFLPLNFRVISRVLRVSRRSNAVDGGQGAQSVGVQCLVP